MRSISARPLLVMMRPPSLQCSIISSFSSSCIALRMESQRPSRSVLFVYHDGYRWSLRTTSSMHPHQFPCEGKSCGQQMQHGCKTSPHHRGELLKSAGLHNVVILGHIELGLTLQKVGTGLDKSISWHIFHGDTATGHPFVSPM